MKVLRYVVLVAALLFIATATLTPGSANFTGSLRPDFWCVACGASGAADVTVNIALFVPLGIAMALMGASSWRGLVMAAALSACIEFGQRSGFPPARVANATDILTNSLGALIGAMLVHSSRSWMLPGKRSARFLIVSSAALIVSVFALTGWALSPLPETSLPTPLEQSRYPFTPGFGWYHGMVSRVTLNETTFAHAGDGPVILRGSTGASRIARVQLTGRDERDGFVPFLYIHGASLADPELLLGQDGNDARLSIKLRGSLLRLPGPHAILPDVFARAGMQQQTIVATVTPAVWSLSSDQGGEHRAMSLAMSLGLGWTLFQTVVREEHPTALIVSALWMFVLWLPLGYWCAFATGVPHSPFSVKLRDQSIRGVLAGVGVLTVTLGLIPVWAGIAASSWVEWVSAFAGYASGVFFASRVWRNQQRLEALLMEHRRLSPLQ